MTDLRKAAEQALEALRNAEVVHMEQLNAMYALQEALAEPELQHRTGDCLLTGICAAERHKIYTAPPKREWVGLTDEEVAQIADSEWEEAFVRLIEAKLKDRNS